MTVIVVADEEMVIEFKSDLNSVVVSEGLAYKKINAVDAVCTPPHSFPLPKNLRFVVDFLVYITRRVSDDIGLVTL